MEFSIFIYIYIYILYICRTSFRKCKFTLLTRNIAHAEFKCGRNIEKNTWSKYTLPYSSLEPYYATSLEVLPSSFEAMLPMDTHTSSRRALKLAQEQEVAEDRRRPRARVLQRLRNKGRESEGREVVLGTLLKVLVKDKLLHSGKVPVNAELRPLRREKRGTEVQRYATLNEAMKI